MIRAIRLSLSRLSRDTILISDRHYDNFTKRHNRLFWIRKYEIPALIKTNPHYFDSIRGKNSASYHMRKATRLGYTFKQIDRNDYLDEITDINKSKEYRQGKRMSDSYLCKAEPYEEITYGVFGSKLVAYAEISENKEVIVIRRILGHGDYLKDGIMYLLVYEIIRKYLQSVKWIMYGSYLFNSEGLSLFKKRFRFQSWRVKWLREH